jgi:hypothetical protein
MHQTTLYGGNDQLPATREHLSESPSRQNNFLDLELSNEQLEFLGFREGEEEISRPPQNYPPLRMLCPDDSQIMSYCTQNDDVSAAPGQRQLDQATVPQHESREIPYEEGETWQYDIPAPQSQPNANAGSMNISYTHWPVALMTTTAVVAPISVLPFTFHSRDHQTLNTRKDAPTSAKSFERHLALAEDYGAFRCTDLAESEYMAAIAKCLSSRKEDEAWLCLQEIKMFLKEDRTPDEVKDSLETCRNLLQMLENEPSSTRRMKDSGMVMLADLLVRDGQLEEARLMYMQVLSLTDDPDIRQMCESSLGKVLYTLWSSNEDAVREQLRIFSKALSEELNETRPPSSALTAMSTIRNRISSIDAVHPCYGLSLIVDQVTDLLAKEIRGCDSGFELRLRELTAELALTCSKLEWNDSANALMCTQVGLLDRLAIGDWGYEKIRGYVDCSAHFQRQRDFSKCIEVIITAYKSMEDLLYSRSVQIYRAGDLPLLRKLKSARERIPIGSYSQSATKMIEGIEGRLEKMIAWNRASFLEEESRITLTVDLTQ